MKDNLLSLTGKIQWPTVLLHLKILVGFYLKTKQNIPPKTTNQPSHPKQQKNPTQPTQNKTPTK